jgi:hypothetical protein
MNQHLHLPQADDSRDGETALEPDNIALILVEMESLRTRMKLLESRFEKISGVKPTDDSKPAPLISVDAQSTASSDTEPVDTATPILPTPQEKSHRASRRRALKKNSNSSGAPRRRRKSRTNKAKKSLLFVYGLVIGGGLISVFAYMMMNLFNAQQYIPAGSSSSAPLEITIDDAPDLEELRRSIQEGEE